MSDYLTNLAARSLAAPSLRPRTRARFEPEANASPWATLPSSEVAVSEDALPVPRMSHRVNAVPIAESVDERPQLERAQHTPRVIEGEPVAQARLDATTPRAMAPTPAHESHIERIETHRETKSTSHVPQTSERLTQRISERVIERIHEPHETIIRNEVTPEGHVADVPTAREQPRHRHDEQPPQITRETQPSTTFITREVHSPSRPMHGAETAQASEPVIHVSIGRVEVRAVTSAPTPQRTRTRNAPMTVEDYAARRNAKGRP